ncbi:MAG: TlpA disulfide reductase family protein [Phycisphaerales bacterium]
MMKQLTAALILAAVSGTASAQDLMGNRSAEQIIAEFEKSSDKVIPEFEMPTLNIGDEAPALLVNHWSKGTPISEFEKGNVYLVDFWATWCGPCIGIMPHLTELQEKHEADGLQVIGVSIWERKEGDDHAQHVDAFVEKNDERMGYAVATGKQQMVTDWMDAAKQGGIPTVMIVDREGKLGWIGYGTDTAIDGVLEDILAEEHNVEELHKSRIKSMKQEHEQKHGPNHFRHFQELAQKDKTEAGAFGQAMLKTKYADNPNAYNAVAWTIVENEGWSPEAISFAKKVATKACELTDWENPMILDTLAWAQYRSGDAGAAVKTQKKAIEILGEDNPQVDSYKEGLETFLQG